jgi:hypothetical protein
VCCLLAFFFGRFFIVGVTFPCRTGQNTESGQRLLRPINNLTLAARMAGDMARNSLTEGNDAESYWRTIRKFLSWINLQNRDLAGQVELKNKKQSD